MLKKTIIIILIFIFIILISILILNKLKLQGTSFYIGENGNIEEIYRESEYVSEKELAKVPKDIENEYLKYNLYYFVVKNCMQQYLNTINFENSEYYGYDINGNYINITNESEKIENVLKILSNRYLNSKNITKDNILDNIDVLKENTIYLPILIKEIYNSDNIKSFVSHGLILNVETYQLIDHVYSIVNLDTSNLTYSIEPINNIENIDEIDFEFEEKEISRNEKNDFLYQTILDEDIAKEYMQTYKKLALAAPELLYEKLDNSRENFKTLDEFKEYINENKEDIMKIELTEYKTNVKTEYKEYILKDKNKNYYIFKEQKENNYTILIKK